MAFCDNVRLSGYPQWKKLENVISVFILACFCS